MQFVHEANPPPEMVKANVAVGMLRKFNPIGFQLEISALLKAPAYPTGMSRKYTNEGLQLLMSVVFNNPVKPLGIDANEKIVGLHAVTSALLKVPAFKVVISKSVTLTIEAT